MSPSPLEWEIEWYSGSYPWNSGIYGRVVIRHNGPKENPYVHYMVPPFSEKSLTSWHGPDAVKWLKMHGTNNLSCVCGNWNIIPQKILEQFIATVNLMESI